MFHVDWGSFRKGFWLAMAIDFRRRFHWTDFEMRKFLCNISYGLLQSIITANDGKSSSKECPREVMFHSSVCRSRYRATSCGLAVTNVHKPHDTHWCTSHQTRCQLSRHLTFIHFRLHVPSLVPLSCLRDETWNLVLRNHFESSMSDQNIVRTGTWNMDIREQFYRPDCVPWTRDSTLWISETSWNIHLCNSIRMQDVQGRTAIIWSSPTVSLPRED